MLLERQIAIYNFSLSTDNYLQWWVLQFGVYMFGQLSLTWSATYKASIHIQTV